MQYIISATLAWCSAAASCVSFELIETNNHIESFIHDMVTANESVIEHQQ